MHFDTQEATYRFEEVPVCIGNIEITFVSGYAFLESESDDYGFYVTRLSFDGNVKGKYQDKRPVVVSVDNQNSPVTDDPLAALIASQVVEHINNEQYSAESRARFERALEAA